MTEQELTAHLQTITDVANARLAAKQVVLDQLGITADEAALLLS